MAEGGCHCGAVRYRVTGSPVHAALCHCSDCRKHAGAPMVSCASYPDAQFELTKGVVKTYASSADGRRQFCADCGTSLFYRNQATLPDMVDIQTATLDDPETPAPEAHIQVAERLGWMKTAHSLPEFARFPEQD